jgi:methylenetetrahydrofolate reductase (NADPH)
MELRRGTESPADGGRSKESIVTFVEKASLEVTMPTEADIELLGLHLRTGTEVFLSDVPRRSGRALIESCARLAAAGLAPVPHVAVRRMNSASSFERLLTDCVAFGGARKAMLIAGDQAEPDGPFVDVGGALRCSDLRRCGVEAVAVAAYPDGHPYVSAEALDQTLTTKLTLLEDQGLETQIVTQFGFDSQAIGGWLPRLRRSGLRNPVSIGMAGPATAATLMKFALRCGVRTATRGLVREAGRLAGLLANPPERLIGLLATIASEPEHVPAKAHFYTFGSIAKTARWISALQNGRFAIVDGAIRLDSSLD